MMIKIIFVNGEQVEEKMTFCESLIFALGGFVRGYTDSIARVDDMPGLYACIESHIDSLVAEIERAARDEGFKIKKERCVKDHSFDNINLLNRINRLDSQVEAIYDDLEEYNITQIQSHVSEIHKIVSIQHDEVSKLNVRLNILEKWANIK